MEALGTTQILDARLHDWRKLAQALHGLLHTGKEEAGGWTASDNAKS